MADADLAIVPFITHKLPIVLRISDRVTVLRRGKVVSCIDTSKATEKSLAREMVGREVIFRIDRTEVERGVPILEVESIRVRSDKGYTAVNRLSFTIHEGEIFGVAGISGNGQRELVEALAGLRKIEGGKIHIDGKDISSSSALKRWQAGIGYIPADRISTGSIGDFSLVENLTMNYYFDAAFTKRGVIDFGLLRQLTENLIQEYDVATPGIEVKAKTLSGGNLQKLILARVLSRKPRLIIVDLPTQGLDVGATEFVRNKLIEAKQEGAGVLLISEDLDEIMSLSDRVAPLYEGHFMGILPTGTAQREVVGAMMAGFELDGETQ
jgi:simple sugar transport system ATP-binding protein